MKLGRSQSESIYNIFVVAVPVPLWNDSEESTVEHSVDIFSKGPAIRRSIDVETAVVVYAVLTEPSGFSLGNEMPILRYKSHICHSASAGPLDRSTCLRPEGRDPSIRENPVLETEDHTI